jgi:hypothetical protein
MNILTAIFLHFPRKDLKQNCLYSRRFFSGAALHDLAAHHHAEPVMDGDEADDDDAMNNPYEDPDSLEVRMVRWTLMGLSLWIPILMMMMHQTRDMIRKFG